MTTRKMVIAVVVLVLLWLASVFLHGQELGRLKSPTTKNMTITEYEIIGGEFKLSPTYVLTIHYRDNLGTEYADTHMGYADPVTNPRGADTLIKVLFRADMSKQSLERRLLQHLAQEGLIPAIDIQGDPR